MLRATILVSLLAYGAAEYLWLRHRARGFAARRLLWTAAFLLCATHVLRAFQVQHGWSHDAAERHTARVTAQVVGLEWGGGIFVNYLFLASWAADVAWSWTVPASYRLRPSWINNAISAVFLFMVFNGAVVFAAGLARGIGIAVTAAVVWAWWRGHDRIVAA